MRPMCRSKLRMRLRRRKIPVPRRLLQLPRASCYWRWPQELAIIAAVVVGGGARRGPLSSLQPLVRLDVDLGPDVSLGSRAGADAILSPDGTRLVYVSQGRLFTRRLDQPKATELAGTEGAFAPFFSPDGQWVAFFTAGKLKKISVEGGSAIALCDATIWPRRQLGRGWQHHRGAQRTGGLSRVPSAGGPPTPVTDLRQERLPTAGRKSCREARPCCSRLTRRTAFDAANIEVMSLADHRRKTLVRGGTFGRYLPSGHLVYVNSGTLFAVPFDLDRLEVRGTPAPVLEQVATAPRMGSAQFDFSQAERWFTAAAERDGGLVTVAVAGRRGENAAAVGEAGLLRAPQPLAGRPATGMEVSDGSDTDIWVYDWQRDTMTRLTFTRKCHCTPCGVPMAATLCSERWSRHVCDPRRRRGQAATVDPEQESQLPWSFTPDGKRLAFS